MKTFTFLTSLVFASLAAAQSSTVSYDTVYDNRSGSLSTVACSDGSHGLLTRGFTTFGSLPGFPKIGGVPAVTGWNSASCGTCWELTYTPATGAARKINIIAIDVGKGGFNIARGAMDTLTNNQAIQLGRAPITYKQVAASVCGLW